MPETRTVRLPAAMRGFLRRPEGQARALIRGFLKVVALRVVERGRHVVPSWSGGRSTQAASRQARLRSLTTA